MKASGKVLQGADSTQRITSKVSTVSLGYLENNPRLLLRSYIGLDILLQVHFR